MRPVQKSAAIKGSLDYKTSPAPIYFQLQSVIKKNIQDRCWKPGDSIPPERKLAEHYRVSVGTVRQAIANLVNEGYLTRLQGKGTFVRETAFRHEHLRYYPMINDFGDPIPDLSADLVSRRVVPGFERPNRLLNVAAGRPLHEIKRRILLHRQPVVFSVSYLPYDMFPDLETISDALFTKKTLYLLIEQHFGWPTIENRELFSAIPAGAEAQKHLAVAKGAPLLHIEMLSLTHQDQPYEYRLSYCRTESARILRVI